MTALPQKDFIQDTIQYWKKIAPVIHEPQNVDDYEKLSDLLGALLEIIAEDESHELMGLVDVISHMIAMYDDEHYQALENGSGIDALKFCNSLRDARFFTDPKQVYRIISISLVHG